MGGNFPCKECSSRHPHCHSDCQTYKAEKAKYDRDREARGKASALKTQLDEIQWNGLKRWR